MKTVKVKFLEDICGVPKGTEKMLQARLAKEMESQKKVKIISQRGGEKVEKMKPKRTEKVETTKAPNKKLAGVSEKKKRKGGK